MKKCTFIRIFSIYFSFGSFDFSIWCFGLKLIFVHVSIPKFKNSEKKSLENEREKRKLLLNHILITKKSILIEISFILWEEFNLSVFDILYCHKIDQGLRIFYLVWFLFFDRFEVDLRLDISLLRYFLGVKKKKKSWTHDLEVEWGETWLFIQLKCPKIILVNNA